MKYLLLLTFLFLPLSLVAADRVCESNNSSSTTYQSNDPTGWNCYAQGHVLVPNEYPGKNYPTDNYIVVLGLTTNSGVVTEHDFNVNTTIGILGRPYIQYSITSIADNGSGSIRVTTGTNTVTTSNKMFCYAASGAGANSIYGIWTVTPIDTTHFDLQGSTFSSSTITTGRCEFPAALKRQGLSSAATTVGKWWVKPGVTLTARGDLIDTWSYATRVARAEDSANTTAFLRCGDSTTGGCTINFDASSANVYGTHGPVASPLRNMQIILRGTATSHARIAAVGAGSGYAILAGAFAGQVSNDLYGDYVDFVNIGKPVGALQSIYFQHEATSTLSLNHFTFQSSGYLSFVGTSPDANLGGTWSISNGVFDANSCSSAFTCMYGLKGPSAAPYVIGPGVAFLSQYNPVSSNQAIGQLIFDGDYFSTPPNLGTSAVSTEVDSEVKNSIIVRIPSQVGQELPLGIEKVTGNFFWLPHDPSGGGNSHMLYVPGHNKLTKMDVSGNVFQHQSDSLDGVGNMFDENTVTSTVFATPTYITYHDNITIPDIDYIGQMGNWRSNNSMAAIVSATNFKWKVYNNTFFGTSDANGFLLGHITSYAPTGKLEEYRCNAIVRSQIYPSIGGAPQVIIGTEAGASAAPVDAAVPAGVHHNAAFGWSTVRSTDSWLTNTVGTRYGFAASAVPAGITNGTDQYFDDRVPVVTDFSRRMLTWANQKYSQTFATEPDVLTYLLADLTRLQDISDLVSWVRTGWTLHESTLYHACNDGTNIGSLVVNTVPPPPPPPPPPPDGAGISSPTDIALLPSSTYQFTGNCNTSTPCHFELSTGHDASSSITTAGLYTAPSPGTPAATTHGTLAGCPLMPHNSIYNVPATGLPLDPNSATMISHMAGLGGGINAGNGGGVNPTPVDTTTPLVYLQPYYDVGFKWAGNYPFRSPQFLKPYDQGVTGSTGSRDFSKAMVQQGWRVTGIDNRWIGVKKSDCTLYEYYIFGAWEAGYHAQGFDGINWSNVGNIASYSPLGFRTSLGLRNSRNSSIAAGMWLSPMQIDADDVMREVDLNGDSANLRHKLAITLSNSAIIAQNTNNRRWPAINWAGGSGTNTTLYIPYGSLLRLNATALSNFNWSAAATYAATLTNAYPGINQTRALRATRAIYNTLRDYGVVVMDGTTNFSQGEMHVRNLNHYDPDFAAGMAILGHANSASPSWGVHLSDLEVVDESALQVSETTYVVHDVSTLPEYVLYKDSTGTLLDTRDVAIIPPVVGSTQHTFNILAGSPEVNLAEDVWANGLPSNNAGLDWTIQTVTPTGGTTGTLAANGVLTPPTTLTAPVKLIIRVASHAYSTAYSDIIVNLLPNLSTGLYLRNGMPTDYTDGLGKKWWARAGGSTGIGIWPMIGSGNASGTATLASNADGIYEKTVCTGGSYIEQYGDFRLTNGSYNVTLVFNSAFNLNSYNYVTFNGMEVMPKTNILATLAGGHTYSGGHITLPAIVNHGRLVIGYHQDGSATGAYLAAIAIEPGTGTNSGELGGAHAGGVTP